MTEAAFKYVGEELDLFAAATVWKSYVGRVIAPYVRGDVLEVGAGLGGTTRWLCPPEGGRWVCLEPDPGLAGRLADALRGGSLPPRCEVVVGTLADGAAGSGFDTLLYMDVLEHIEDDRGELAAAAAALAPGGHVVVLSPAHQWLFTPFDQAIGHYRRYTLRGLRGLTPPDLEPVKMVYLDAVGLLASLGNKVLLRSAMPTAGQVAFWDKCLVRASRVVDPLLFHRLGKSVLGVWRKRG